MKQPTGRAHSSASELIFLSKQPPVAVGSVARVPWIDRRFQSRASVLDVIGDCWCSLCGMVPMSRITEILYVAWVSLPPIDPSCLFPKPWTQSFSRSRHPARSWSWILARLFLRREKGGETRIGFSECDLSGMPLVGLRLRCHKLIRSSVAAAMATG